MKVRFAKSFVQLYTKLPASTRKKVDKNIDQLAQDIRHPGVKARKLVNHDDVWEARVDYHYRMTFEIQGDTLVMRKVGTHQIYRKP